MQPSHSQDLRAAASSALVRHGVLELMAAIEQLREQLAQLRRERSIARGTMPWWEVPHGASVDSSRARVLDRRVGELELAERDRLSAFEHAVDQAQAELPPIGIVVRVERCLDLSHAAALSSTSPDDALVAALEDLADRVLGLWAPGLSTEMAADELMDPARASAAAAADPGPPRPDPRLGWAASTPSEILCRAARALDRPEIDAARERVVRERAEYEQCAARLHEVRKGAGLLRRSTSHDAAARERLVHQVATERHELTAAWEALHHAVGHALAATPPLHIARTAVAAAGVLRARLTTWEVVIVPTSRPPGTMMFSPRVSRRGRAVMFAALRDLQIATEEAFPGLLGLLAPSALPGVAPARPDGGDAHGPYRQPPKAEPIAAAAFGGQDVVSAVAHRARESGLDQRLRSLVAHGAALGAVARSERRVTSERGIFEKIGGWFSSQEDPVEARTRWHRALAFAMLDQAEATIASARSGMFALDFRAALAAAAGRFIAISVVSKRAPIRLTCALRGQHETIEALAEARRLLVGAWGDPGDRMALIQELHATLRPGTWVGRSHSVGQAPRALSRRELVAVLADQLCQTPFLAVAEILASANHEWMEASRLATDASSRVTLWDRLNVVTDSEAEITKKSQGAVADRAYREGRAAFARVDALLEQALAAYPPAAVVHRLDEVTRSVSGLHAIKVKQMPRRPWNIPELEDQLLAPYACEMWGTELARDAFSRLATAAVHAFGMMLSDTEILADHCERALDAPP